MTSNRWTLVRVGALLAALLVWGPRLGLGQTERAPLGQTERAPLGQTERAPLVVEMLDVGQGDSILIETPEGKHALVDAGPTKRGAAEQLAARGIERLDLVVVSHHHSDHYGGMEEVIRSFAPRYFLASESAHMTRGYLQVLKAVEEGQVVVLRPLDRQRRIELGSVLLTVFPRTLEDRREENNNSVGLRLQYGGFSMLLTGDSESAERSRWLRSAGDLVAHCTILKLAHHGSRNGLDPLWLALVDPEMAIASTGAGNAFGHPHPETLSLLEREGIPLLRTDQVGSIAIESDGQSWRLLRPGLGHSGAPGRGELDEAIVKSSGGRERAARGRVR